MKLKQKILAFLIGKLIGKDSKFILIHLQEKELDKLIAKQECSIYVKRYCIPNFAAKEIIINISEDFDRNEIMLDRITYEAENNINC